MRRLDDDMIDPSVGAALDAIDATLAGEPVDPEHAELAELALLLAAQRPEIDAGFASSLDTRVSRRFAASGEGSPKRTRAWITWRAGVGALAAGLAAAVIVVMVGSGTRGSGPVASTALSTHAPQASGATDQSFRSTSSTQAAPAPASAASSGSGGQPATLQPPNNGRKVVQSAELSLTASPTRIENVAQEVFDVIGRENGVVRRSSVTATGGSDGSADFQLSVPSASLADTMAALSRLRYANVASRTDSSQDVNDTYVSVVRQLADARALRAALLRQLAGATTQQQVASLNARIRDAESAIAGYEARLRALNRRINFSEISVSINAAVTPVGHSSGGSSFTLGKALHTAGRVLTVAAGVALIVLAALVPVALFGGLVWWVGAALRRRRREQALDLA